jgi:beta-aspartyl-dipeptidase (metallo-type)
VFNEDGRVIRMGVGDAGGLMLTIRRLLQRGHALEQILPTFTTNVADLLRLQRKGRIAVDYDADLVVLGPEYDVQSVMARGRWHLKDAEVLRFGVFEPVRAPTR